MYLLSAVAHCWEVVRGSWSPVQEAFAVVEILLMFAESSSAGGTTLLTPPHHTKQCQGELLATTSARGGPEY